MFLTKNAPNAFNFDIYKFYKISDYICMKGKIY